MNKISKIANCLKQSKTTDVGHLRFRDSGGYITVTDMTNAGLRGKKVSEFQIGLWNMDETKVKKLLQPITSKKTYTQALQEAKKIKKTNPELEFNEFTLRGVDVTPATFKPIKLKGKDFTLVGDIKHFTITEHEDNECTLTNRKKTEAVVFYKLVSQNLNKVQQMTFSEIKKFLEANKVDFRMYCALD